MKPLPPYAKDARVVEHCIWIRCGLEAWDWCKAHADRGEIAFPGDKCANEYRWDFVQGIACYVVSGSAPFARIEGLVTALLLAGSPEVTVIDSRLPEHYSKADWAGMMTFFLDEMRDVG